MSAIATSLLDRSLALGGFVIDIEPGHEEIWFAIRDMRKLFSADDLARACGASPSKVAQLVRKGVLEMYAHTTDQVRLYRVEKLAITPLVLDEQGRPSADYACRHALWSSIRVHKTFSERSLWQHVREHVNIPRKTVAEWIRRMLRAGYICCMFGQGREGETEYQLKPAMNTGRIPPRFCEATLVFDINRRQLYGNGIAREVRL
jgi:hypothetical protein